jgi:Arc/MetJ-type ribon-helix-helix transcriptional regulator
VTVVPIRLSRQDARKLDLLVKLGVYRNRTEAIRAMIHAKADEHVSRYMFDEKVLRVLDELLKQETRTKASPLRILTDKTAAQIVAEGRE